MELLQGLRISVVSSRFGFAFRTHGGHSKSCHVVADVCRFAGRVGDIHIVVEDAHGKSKLCQFTVVHDDIRLEAAVLCAIQQQVYLAVDFSKTIEQINKAPLVKSQSKKLYDAIEQKEREFAKIVRYKQAIYQDWKDGEITHQDYRHMKEEYEQQAETLNQVLERLREEQRELENGIDPQDFAQLYPEYNALAGECRFQPCLHDREPGCAVHAAVDAGRLGAARWLRYRELLAQVRENWKGRYE